MVSRGSKKKKSSCLAALHLDVVSNAHVIAVLESLAANVGYLPLVFHGRAGPTDDLERVAIAGFLVDLLRDCVPEGVSYLLFHTIAMLSAR